MNLSSDSFSGSPVRVTGPDALAAREFQAFAYSPVGAFLAGPLVPPGAVRRLQDKANLLHYAPGRFLAPSPSPATIEQLSALEARGHGMLFDVTGKWSQLAVAGPDARRLLSATLDVRSVLRNADCAAVHLFDCPAVISSCRHGYELWVETSYARTLAKSLSAVRAQL